MGFSVDYEALHELLTASTYFKAQRFREKYFLFGQTFKPSAIQYIFNPKKYS